MLRFGSDRCASSRSGVARLLAISLGMWTCAVSPTHAYRTAADLPEIPNDQVVRWEQTVELSLNRSQPRGFSSSEVQSALEQALTAWTSPDCTTFSWRPVETTDDPATPGDGKSVVQWVSSGWVARGFDSEEPAVTDVHYERIDDQWQIVEADIHLNADTYRFNDADETLKGVLTHEVGHVLGLLHACEDEDDLDSCDEDAVMHPIYSAPKSLSDDDISGLCTLYPLGPSSGNDDCLDEDAGMDCSEPRDDDSVRSCPDASADASASDCAHNSFEFGQACREGDDCVSKLCVADSESANLCTQLCSADEPCPFGWECSAVDFEFVCTPKPEDSGCSTQPVNTSQTRQAKTLTLCAIALLLYSRRAHRPRDK